MYYFALDLGLYIDCALFQVDVPWNAEISLRYTVAASVVIVIVVVIGVDIAVILFAVTLLTHFAALPKARIY